MKNCAVVYCRVSTEEQTENNSLPNQLKVTREAARKLGCKVLGEFIENESGAKMDRTEMLKMIVFCTKHRERVQYVIVKDIDRFSRDTLVHLTLRSQFRALGIELYSVNQPSIADGTAEGQLSESIFSAFAQFERSKILQRTQMGTKEVILRGGWTCSPPCGYQRHRREDNLPTLLPVPEEAKTVLTAFELRANGLPLLDIAAKMKALGYRSRQDKPLSFQTIDNWLNNPVYIGKIRSKNFPDQLLDGAHPPIVPVSLWNRVQQKLSKKAVLRQKFNPAFPLTTILRCDKCNTPITGSLSTGKSGKKYAYYHCRKTKCPAKNFKRQSVESAFLNILKYVQFTRECMDFIEKNIVSVWRMKWLKQAEEGRKLDTQLVKLKAKREQIEDKYISNKIAKDTYDRHLAKVNEEIATVGTERENLLISEERLKELLKFTRSFMISISDTWENAVPMRKRLIQKVVFPDGVQLNRTLFFRTLKLPLLLELKKVSIGQDSKLAAPPGIEPGLQE
jgi:site-specific DNA recombinase